jgi:hypothetical protein
MIFMNTIDIESLKQMDIAARYTYFLQQAAASGSVWVLEEARKLLSLGDDEESMTLPVWPVQAAAEYFINDEISTYEAQAIPLEDFLEMLDEIEEDGVRITVLPVRDHEMMHMAACVLKEDLLQALQSE